jgi:hypothetical protein
MYQFCRAFDGERDVADFVLDTAEKIARMQQLDKGLKLWRRIYQESFVLRKGICNGCV